MREKFVCVLVIRHKEKSVAVCDTLTSAPKEEVHVGISAVA